VVAAAALERLIALGYAGRGDPPEATGAPDAPLAYRITGAGLARLIDAGHLRPAVEAAHPLAREREAFERGPRGYTRGKLVLRIDWSLRGAAGPDAGRAGRRRLRRGHPLVRARRAPRPLQSRPEGVFRER
jgi:hypothetical protein